MKNNEVESTLMGLNVVVNLKGFKLAYAVSKNKECLSNEKLHFDDVLKESKEFEEYEKTRIELCKKMAKKDENGKPVMLKTIQGNFTKTEYVFEDKISFDKKFEGLRKKNQKTVDARDAQIDDYNKNMKEESKVEVYKIPMSHIEAEYEDITVAQYDAISFMVDETK